VKRLEMKCQALAILDNFPQSQPASAASGPAAAEPSGSAGAGTVVALAVPSVAATHQESRGHHPSQVAITPAGTMYTSVGYVAEDVNRYFGLLEKRTYHK
jgi:hypothetical protein